MKLEEIKDEPVRELLLYALKRGKEVVQQTYGHANLSAGDLMLVGFAKMMVEREAMVNKE